MIFFSFCLSFFPPFPPYLLWGGVSVCVEGVELHMLLHMEFFWGSECKWPSPPLSRIERVCRLGWSYAPLGHQILFKLNDETGLAFT